MSRSEPLVAHHPRRAAVAGLFYPDDPDILTRQVHTCIRDGLAKQHEYGIPRAIIAPHAGYDYSGPIAGTAYQCIEPVACDVQRVLILSPSHHVAFSGIALPAADAFDTPVGSVPVDVDMVRELASLPFVVVDDLPHEREHGIEVHLPFCQTLLSMFTLIPVVVGDASADDVAQVIERCWDEAACRAGVPSRTMVIVSSDLSHFLDAASARRVDAVTSRAIEKLASEQIGPDMACGATAIRGLLEVAQAKRLTMTTLDVRNSADTAGSPQRVVGYGAYVLH